MKLRGTLLEASARFVKPTKREITHPTPSIYKYKANRCSDDYCVIRGINNKFYYQHGPKTDELEELTAIS